MMMHRSIQLIERDGRLGCTHFHGSTEESYQGSAVLWSRPRLPIVDRVKGRRHRRNSILLAKLRWGCVVKIFPKLLQKVKTKRGIFNTSLKEIQHWNLNLIGKEIPQPLYHKTRYLKFSDKILANRVCYYVENPPYDKVGFNGEVQAIRKLEVKKSKMYVY